jgi:signal transduction histidine kinase/ligand-binding sensor domain-containing protein
MSVPAILYNSEKVAMILLRSWFIGFVCNLYLVPAIAQVEQLRFDHITVENGLSQSWVHCIFQDKYDFIWIGTEDGLNLYDGQQMIQFRHNIRDTNSISSNTVSTIYEDSRGNFWVGTTNGLNLYDRKSGHFNFIDEIRTWSVISIVEDKDKSLWIGTVYKLYHFNPVTRSVKVFSANDISQDSISNNYINQVFFDSDWNLWIATNSGLNLYNPQNQSFIKYFNDTHDPSSLGSDVIFSILEDNQKRIWLGTSLGLCLFKNAKMRPERGSFITYKHNENIDWGIGEGRILTLLEDHHNNLWIGIENGGLNKLDLKNFDQDNARFEHYEYDPMNRYSLNNNSIQTIFQDKQNIIWIGTFGNGINKLNQADATFTHFMHEPQKRNSLSDNHVNTFLDDGDYAWIGTEGGLNRYSKKDGSFKRFVHDPRNTKSIGSNAVWAIFKDSRGNLWIGTWAGGLNRYNYADGTFSHYYFDPDDSTSIGSNNIFSILEDSNKNLWIGTMGDGINKFNYETGKFQRFNIGNTDLNSNFVEAIIDNKDNTLWLANVTSLERFNTKSLTFEHFMQIADDTSSLIGNKIFCIYKDSEDILWVGTDAGLNRFFKETGRFICYFIEDGLPDNSIKSIVEDKHGHLWIGTNKGLSKMSKQDEPGKKVVFKNFTPKGGLQGFEFERRSCMQDRKGNLYFGGINGFNIFHPDSIKSNTFIPNIVITEFLLFNKKVYAGAPKSPLKKNITVAKELKLTYKQSVFSFKFRALNYRYPENNEYAYRMIGFNDRWIKTGNQGEATFTNLDPGTYVFQAKGSNDDGIWNETGTSIKIIILPPWWQTWWFRILAAMLAVLILVLFFFWRVRELRSQKANLEKKVHERTKEIEEKNMILQKQTRELNETNILLEERQEYIEEQAEELKALADDLMDVNKNLITLNATKDKFFSIIAHDLKNPFTSILGFCEVLFTRYDVYDDNKRKHLIGIINQSAQNIYKLLENLLQWARSQTGTIKYNPEVFEIEEIITNNITLMENQMIAKNILTEKHVTEGIKVYADKNMINTVIRNLISNAIKFSEGGRIVISVVSTKNNVKVSVADTGKGMAPEVAKVIFDIGTSKSTEGTRGESGTGLGLIICKDFIDKHDGKIGVESNVNKGSIFYFTIPIH